MLLWRLCALLNIYLLIYLLNWFYFGGGGVKTKFIKAGAWIFHELPLLYTCTFITEFVFASLTWASPACSVPPGPVKSSSLLVQMWSRKSSTAFWFSSAPMKRFHLSVFTRSTQKACSRRKSTLSSDKATPALRAGSWGTRTPPAPPLPKPALLLLMLVASAMKTQLGTYSPVLLVKL